MSLPLSPPESASSRSPSRPAPPLAAAPAPSAARGALGWLSRSAPVRRALALSTLLSAAALACTGAAWVITARLVAAGLLDRALPALSELLLVGALLLGRVGLNALREFLGARLAARMVRQWRAELVAHALALGPAAGEGGDGTGTAGLLDLDRELTRLTPYYARYLPGAAHSALAFALVAGLTLWLDPLSGVLLLIAGPLAVLLLALAGLATGAATERQWLAQTRLSARLLTLVRELPTLHAFGGAATYRDVLARSARQQRETTMRVLRVAFLSGFVMDFAATLSTAVIAVWIGVRLFGGTAELAPTLAALMLVPEFFGPLRALGADRHAAMDAEPLAARLRTLLSRGAAPQGAATVAPGVPALTFSGARADLGERVPGTLNAVLAPGTHAALQGPSGSGKTTLLQALRKHRPHQGKIRVNGAALDTLEAAAWQARVALVPQHPRLLAASLRDNLRLSRPDTADAVLWTALEATGLAALARGLPQGLDTPLGEGGTWLSGGETARLALARALLSGADVVLLDEVTAHLDPASEAGVYAAAAQALAGRTVLLATHRDPPAGWPVLTLHGGSA
ncbi:ABC transporter ATP-binding protein/permease [Deinococcus sp. Leaf326]|uniref:ABC transporter ATP-binding protein/permease n=1 Tax=Deinococcus sp. Leaf326 TaxID=1736338 RepID=UPI0006FB55F1|nr:ATP-binding cassette domain-containing protein [Deinococcus sp. Leaf326]KQR22977.1 ABC transporter [Deinococcus sp. Leaf326]